MSCARTAVSRKGSSNQQQMFQRFVRLKPFFMMIHSVANFITDGRKNVATVSLFLVGITTKFSQQNDSFSATFDWISISAPSLKSTTSDYCRLEYLALEQATILRIFFPRDLT